MNSPEQYTQREQHLSRYFSQILSETDIDILLKDVLRSGMELLNLDSGGILLCHHENPLKFQEHAAAGMSAAYPGEFIHDKYDLIPRVLDQKRIMTLSGIELDSPVGQSWQELGFHFVTAAPLLDNNQLFGVIHFQSTAPGFEFDSFQQQSFQLFVQYTAVAVRSARRYQEIEVREKFLEDAQGELEMHVASKTSELQNAIGSLHNQVAERKKLEEALQKQTLKLKERIKELHILYGVSRLVTDPDVNRTEVFEKTVRAVQANWHHPEYTAVRIVLDFDQYQSDDWKHTMRTVSASIVFDRKKIGVIEVGYLDETPSPEEERFRREDRKLLDAVGGLLSDYVQRFKKEDELNRYKDHLEEMVRHRTAELEQFVFVASHDLQEPLRKILAFGDRLTTCTGSTFDDKGTFYMERMTDNAHRMRQLLDDLLLYSQIIKKMHTFKEIHLHSLLEKVLQELQPVIREKNATVEISPSPPVFGDPWRIRRLFFNLISNSLKYAKEDESPIVTIGGQVTPDRQFVRIAVRDNGIGFDERYNAKIFKPFKRLHCKNEYTGTGMGLSICKKIVEQHGGNIRADSIPGKGSTFTLELPAYKENMEEANEKK